MAIFFCETGFQLNERKLSSFVPVPLSPPKRKGSAHPGLRRAVDQGAVGIDAGLERGGAASKSVLYCFEDAVRGGRKQE